MSAFGTQYLQTVQLVERLYCRLLEAIEDEFDRQSRSEINVTQALLLFYVGDAEMTVGELRSRGYHLSLNLSYNLAKLADLGFIGRRRSESDRR
jgi:DNA-binding MarR family transcriptional regulator